MHPLAVVRDRDVRLPLHESGVEARSERRSHERRVAGNDEDEIGGGGRERARHAGERTLEPLHPVRDDGMAVAGVALGAPVRIDGERRRLRLDGREHVLDHGPPRHLDQPLVDAAHPRPAAPGQDYRGHRVARIGAGAHISPIFTARVPRWHGSGPHGLKA